MDVGEPPPDVAGPPVDVAGPPVDVVQPASDTPVAVRFENISTAVVAGVRQPRRVDPGASGPVESLRSHS